MEGDPVGSRSRAAALALCAALLAAACYPPPDTTAGPARAQDAPSCRGTLVGVAHPDDDVFFLTPEIRHTIRAGCRVDTVYLTAGDDGKKNRLKAVEYVDRREYGVRAAYAEMAEASNDWKRADVQADGVRVRSYLLADKDRDTDVRLTFLDLHDGLPQGGSPNSLLKLFEGNRNSIEPFQGGSGSYTESELLATVSALTRLSGAERILTMDHDNASFAFGLGGGVDHSDHGITARYLRKVGYALGIPVSSYLGYTMSPLKPNLTAAESAEKDEVARWYIANRKCRATGTCANVAPFKGPLKKDWSLWIHRQYQQTPRDPRAGELMGDIGRTTFFTSRSPEQCLHADSGKVDIRACDGSASQKWDLGHDKTIRLRSDRGSCLTASEGSARLTSCKPGDPDQQWTRMPWQSTSWKRTAWQISGSGNRCLYQDDRELPAHWDARDRQNPQLKLSACGKQPMPELYWRWGG
nr:lipoprotein [Streptomyces tsukubensis NRRL18488]